MFRQKAKVVELTNEYQILSEDGAEIGFVRQEGQSALKKAVRLLSSLDQFLTHRLAVTDASGERVITLVRPAKIVKSRVQVLDAQGDLVGEIVQQNVFGKIRFGLMSPMGAELGEIRAENWRAWNFSIVDAADREVARITKTWEGMLRTAFTTADHYLLKVDPSLRGPLRTMVLAAAVGVDTALKQDSRGLG